MVKMTEEAYTKAHDFVRKNALAFASKYIKDKKKAKIAADNLIDMVENPDDKKLGVKGCFPYDENLKSGVIRSLIVEVAPTDNRVGKDGGCWVSLSFEEIDTEKFMACISGSGE
jgi:hypothetical protein